MVSHEIESQWKNTTWSIYYLFRYFLSRCKEGMNKVRPHANNEQNIWARSIDEILTVGSVLKAKEQ